MKCKKYSEFNMNSVNEEISIHGNIGIPEEKLRDIEQKGRDKIRGDSERSIGFRIMQLIDQSKRYTNGKENELEELAEEVIRDVFQGVLDDIDLDIKLLSDGSEINDFIEEENERKSKEDQDDEIDDEIDDEYSDDLNQDYEDEPTETEIKLAVDKRKLINNIIQGEAKNTKHILHLPICKEGLERIFGNRWQQIFNIWDEISKLSDKMDWIIPIDIKSRMMEEQPLGMAGACSVKWPKSEGDKSISGDGDLSQDSDIIINPTIMARGIDFPMLLHETVKGIYEAISDPGLPKSRKLTNIVHQQTGSFRDEAEDFKYGPYLAADLRDFINKNPKVDKYPNIREYVFGRLIDMDRYSDEECLINLKNIFLESPKGRQVIDEIIDEIIDELNKWELGEFNTQDTYKKDDDVDYSTMSQIDLMSELDDKLDKLSKATTDKEREVIRIEMDNIHKYLKNESLIIFDREINRLNENFKK